MIYSHYSDLMALAMDMSRPGPDEGQLEFLQSYLKSCEMPVLDLACGTGRLLFPIKKLGYEVIGIDSSPEMLKRCKLKENEYGFQVKTYKQFMQNFSINMLFGLIFIADCSFDLLVSESDQIATIQNVKRHLKPGGTFLFDIETIPDPNHMKSGNNACWVSSKDGKQIIISRTIYRYDPKTNLRPGVKTHELFINGNLKNKQAFEDPMRFNDPKIICKLLEDEGFIDIGVGKYQSDEPPLNKVGELVSIRCKKPLS